MMGPAKFRRIGRRRGMGLVEAMVTVAISSMITIAAIGVLVYSQKATLTAFRHNKTNEEARLVADTIAKDLRGAYGLEASFSDGTTTFILSTTTLILRLPSVNNDLDRFMDFGDRFDRVIYHPDENNPEILIRSERPDHRSGRDRSDRAYGTAFETTAYFAPQVIAQGAFVVHYQFTITRAMLGRRLSMSVSGSARLRNHPL